MSRVGGLGSLGVFVDGLIRRVHRLAALRLELLTRERASPVTCERDLDFLDARPDNSS